MHFLKSSFKFKELLKAFIALFSPKKFILFGEKGNMQSDNSWELFLYSLKNPSINKYCYFVTEKEAIYKEQNRFIRNHLIERYSRKHLLYFLQAKALIFSFDLYSLLPNLDQNIQPFLRRKIKTVLLSHGFSAGQVNSVLISPFFSNNKDFVAISSPLEREYLTSIGYEDNKLVSCGYPRMDKWSKFSITSTRTVTIAFTWRRDLITKNIDEFIRSFYFQNSIKILQRVSDLISPSGSIYFIIHNAFPKHLVIAMTGYILGHFPNVIVSSSEDDRLNEALINSSDLITDVSSIGIDFSKKN